uniref:Uncharacterized protein n=1 Tax=Xiphophorus couchianus TaxID=32473 RepID=A0A3B5MXL8_9TELE
MDFRHVLQSFMAFIRFVRLTSASFCSTERRKGDDCQNESTEDQLSHPQQQPLG